MIRKHKKVYTTFNYIEHFLILASAITGCISISAFACFFLSSEIELKVCAITQKLKKINQ